MSDRLEKLKLLQDKLEVSLETCDDKSLAAIARQYRETMKEIEELEGADATDDEIANIMQPTWATTAHNNGRSAV